MNQRIQELEKQSVFYNEDEEIWEIDPKKFAELIICECAQVANDSNQSMNRAVGASVGDVIRKYFGVEL